MALELPRHSRAASFIHGTGPHSHLSQRPPEGLASIRDLRPVWGDDIYDDFNALHQQIRMHTFREGVLPQTGRGPGLSESTLEHHAKYLRDASRSHTQSTTRFGTGVSRWTPVPGAWVHKPMALEEWHAAKAEGSRDSLLKPGDEVFLDRGFAEQFGKKRFGKDFKITTRTTDTNYLFNKGDSLVKFRWHPALWDSGQFGTDKADPNRTPPSPAHDQWLDRWKNK